MSDRPRFLRDPPFQRRNDIRARLGRLGYRLLWLYVVVTLVLFGLLLWLLIAGLNEPDGPTTWNQGDGASHHPAPRAE